MLNASDDIADGFLRHFLLQVVAPLLAVILLIALAGFQAIRWAAEQSDTASRTEQQRVVEVALGQAITSLATEQRSVALWRPLSIHLLRSPTDRGFLDENIGGWLHLMFGHDATYLLSPEGHPVYASVAGSPRPSSEYATVRPYVAALFRTLQDNTRRNRAQAGPSAAGEADGNTAPALAQVQGILTVHGTPTLVAASYIPSYLGRQSRPSWWALPLRADVGSVEPALPNQSDQQAEFAIVSLVAIDNDFLHDLSKRAVLPGLRYIANADLTPDDAGVFPLFSFDGVPLGRLVWQAHLPGTMMARILLPVAAATLAIVAALLGGLTWARWRSSCRLLQAMRELRASEAHAQHLAFHDVLTGLPNRALFDERFRQTLARSLRAGRRVALLMMDLDRFKQVNDTIGHHAGDELIREVAARLTKQAGEGELVARLGGDEFVLILSNVRDAAAADRRCQELQTALRCPLEVLGNRIVPAATVGYVLAPDDGTECGDLLRKADIALYAAKSAGRDVFRRFEQGMDDTVRLRNAIAVDLRAAMEGGDGLTVHYQPQVDVTGRKVVGLEALLRWRHPTRGSIRPDQFIPIAEETGIIGPLGEWVFRCACQTASRWPGRYMAVNVSPVQFRSAGFAERLIAIAAAEECKPNCIELEITEGVLLEDDERARSTLATLREAGFKIALDDFGTGYSSLRYLQRFTVDKIKIDRSFTQSLGTSPDAPAIIDSVVSLGKAMGLSITAEGVETREQMSALVAAGCSELQGFLFSRPRPEQELHDAISKVERGEPVGA